jgi:hypothetical protein
MIKMLLLTQTNGRPILISSEGMTIEPEGDTQRTVLIMPSNNRQPPRVVVQQPFVDICHSLQRAGHLIEVTPEEKVAPPQPKVVTPSETVEQATIHNAEPAVAEAVPAPAPEVVREPTKNRRAKR